MKYFACAACTELLVKTVPIILINSELAFLVILLALAVYNCPTYYYRSVGQNLKTKTHTRETHKMYTSEN